MSSADQIALHERPKGVRLGIRVAPRAKRNAIVGVHDGLLKVSLTAPPVDGEANDELIRYLSKTLSLPRSAITLVQGDTSRTKVLELECDATWLRQRLREVLE